MSPYLLPMSDHDSQHLPAGPNPQAAKVNERDALDAYSRVIVSVAEKLGPAVVNLRRQSRRKPGLGRLRVRLSDHSGRVSPDQSPRRARLEPDARSAQ